MIRFATYLAVGFLTLVLGYVLFQRKLLYYPTHHTALSGLAQWRHDGMLIGYARETPKTGNVWLLLHGNAGQASDRVYALPSFPSEDSVFILEYPGYGTRSGSPSMTTFNAAAEQAYGLLKARFPGRPVSVVGESIGSGPASVLAKHRQPPDKIVLIVPFDILSRVARHHVPFVPAELLLRDNWNNIEALRGYRGTVEIYGARDDTIIPVAHARALAASVPSAHFHELEGGHNDWADPGRVHLSYP